MFRTIEILAWGGKREHLTVYRKSSRSLYKHLPSIRRGTEMTQIFIIFFAVMVVGNYANGEDLSEADLGRMLYFDTSFSANGTMACATCHDPQKGFTDPRVNAGHGMVSLGDNGHSFGNRNAPWLPMPIPRPNSITTRNCRSMGGCLDGCAAFWPTRQQAHP